MSEHDFQFSRVRDSIRRDHDFKFSPLDFVTVTAYGLDYRARVDKCLWCAGGLTLYEVEYVDDGAKICNGTFREDELTARVVP